MNDSVLLIDDEKSFRIIVDSALREEGYEVRVAHNAQSGIDEWRRRPADIVLLDRNLPDADGVDVLSKLRAEAQERNIDSVFLVVTAYAEVDNAVEALKRGAEDYLIKPIQLSDLVVKLRKALEKRRLERRVRALRHGESDVVHLLRRTRNDRMKQALEMAEKVAASPSTPVLLEGESGAGKDMLARYIHALTPERCEAAFIELNCASIAEQLAESELFGHERGAFTDAKQSRRGLVELADEGTLFLDEIADLGPGVQAKLLRVLETMRFRRVGGARDLHVDVRIISATNRELADEVAERRFRLDLYHRLNVFHLQIPPLRQRPEDVVPLAHEFMQATARRLGKPLEGISDAAQRALQQYSFPGNVRELKNLIERAVILESQRRLTADSLVLTRPRTAHEEGTDHFFYADLRDDGQPPPLREVEREYIERVLGFTRGNKSRAARILDVTFPTISKKITDYGIKLGDG